MYFIKCILASTSTNSNGFDGSEMGLCLALLIATTVVCGTDVPFLCMYFAFDLERNFSGKDKLGGDGNLLREYIDCRKK